MQSSELKVQYEFADAQIRQEAGADGRKKRWSSKAKTGCATCRSRRIKCDEGKPVCRRCVFSKRQCGGYIDQPQPEYASSATSSGCSAVSTPDPIPQPGSGLGIIYTEASSLEQQMFYTFRNDTVLQVGCVFDMRFWLVDVPQAAQAHRPIWHASIALAALQSSRNAVSDNTYPFSGDAMDGVTDFVMRHYHAAMDALVPLSSPAEDVPTFETQQVLLMTNVLLLGLASMQGNQRDATLFSRHSLDLFHRWRFWERQENWQISSQGAMLSVTSMTALMYRLQGQEVADRFQRPGWLRSDFYQYSKPPSAIPFTSTTEAYLELQPLFAGMSTVAQEQQLRPYTNALLPPPDACLAFRYSFVAWRAKFNQLRDSQTLEQNSAVDTLILDLLNATGEVALYTGADYSPLLRLHRHMVDTAEQILTSISPTDKMGETLATAGAINSSIASPAASRWWWCTPWQATSLFIWTDGS
ncbi:hypothetical protein NQ176_g9495 [Zarea fungicola]|uniref:Uncharacterized protein n=1 Tax=Zarea fungicola TaxID=93591 RepID=A0ACC1MMN6_9HYPO|nr:hypothetical protein NQ176_g9495 [Lecanicillium fungicola]